MSEAALRAQARARTEARMTDACTARRKTGETTDDDGNVTPTMSTVYTGPCRMKQPKASGDSSFNSVGEASVVLQRLELHLPMSAEVLRPSDQITITASDGDPESVGRVFLVVGVPAYSAATARRYGVTERTG